MARPRKTAGPIAYEKPAGSVRRSQVVRTFGPGAMIDLVDHAVMIGGLDFWRYRNLSGSIVSEPRLRDRLAPGFKAAGRDLAAEGCFRLPPLGDDKKATPDSGIEVLELPRWFVCQNPACRALVRADGLEPSGSRYRHRCGRSGSAEAVPVRFVATCRRGHVEEFPWAWFAHRNQDGPCAAPSLRLLEGATGDFSEIEVVCACGARERLSTALVPGSLLGCGGHRPWLGEAGREACTEPLRLLVRSASNAWFGQEVSALSIPERGRKLEAAVRQVWDILSVADAGNLAAFRQIPQVKQALGSETDADVLSVIEQIRLGGPVSREPLRTAEYRQLIASADEKTGDLPPASGDFYARKAEPEGGPVPNIKSLILVPKLREVRVQIGFTRLEPVMPDLEGEFDLEVQSAPLSLTQDWLPATEIRGEGVFIQLDEKAVREWEWRPEVRQREIELRAGYADWTGTLREPDKAPPFLGVRFYLLHSLSHLLITAISLECGYAASAIRERIYCAAADSEVPMAAILLSTGSPGTEGTLGGLVEQGRNLKRHLTQALDLGRLCSNDPVCAGHTPQKDLAERHLEGAACHGCLFIAESSCERFNRHLDRALVVPAMGHAAGLAFFDSHIPRA
ncbi:MAG: DUF1998 domain-containing protein [Acidobacteriota bacterium]